VRAPSLDGGRVADATRVSWLFQVFDIAVALRERG
jgi:hypothetical protein